VLNTAEDLKAALVKASWGAEEDILGCTLKEISSLEGTLHVELPTEYKSFLLTMGKKAAALSMYDEMNLSYDEVLITNRPNSQVENLKQRIYNKLAILEGWKDGWKKILLICMRQNYDMFLFIYANGNEDTSVFFSSGDMNEKIGNSLSAFYEFIFNDASQLLTID
jgi:hypothetical protein